MSRFWKRWHVTAASAGSRSSTPVSSWLSLAVSRSGPSQNAFSATPPPSGGSADAASRAAFPCSCWTTHALGGPWRFPPLQRAQIVELACLEPVARGLHITHWASQDLARQAVADGIIASISRRTVRRILDDVDLQPHRTRYWRTARLDGQFKERAEKVLWCYCNAQRLAGQGIWTVAIDEKPNLQVLERSPIRRAIPGSIEQQEFEYVRHGTVNLLFFLVVHSGQMEVAVEASKDARHCIQELKAFRGRHRTLKGVYLIQDGDPSHTAGATEEYLRGCRGWWRSRLTPAHA